MVEDEDVIRTLSGEVRVASRIVDYLSSGLYKSPAACLKELVNNSYDADAEDVYLYVKPSANTVTLEDNGLGLTSEQFEKHFSMIAESHKRDDTEVTAALGREKIGKIGIGFIAANELCNLMRIESTVAGSSELLDVTINFGAMRDDFGSRRDEEGTLHKGDYQGVVVGQTDSERHFTRITLSELRPHAQDALIRSTAEVSQDTVLSLYGLTPDQIDDALSRRVRSWTDFDKYSQTQLHVALNVPVEYHNQWLGVGATSRTSTLGRVKNQFSNRAKATKFRVFYDGSELRKPTVLRAQRGTYVAKALHYEGDEVSYDGYLFAGHGTLEPAELQGVLIRIREAAVGEYRHDLLDFPVGRFSLLQRWVSSEIYASDKLEDAMNIDRSTLRDTHPAYVELRSTFHQFLQEFLSEVREKLYRSASIERKVEKAEGAGARIIEELRVLRSARGKGSSPRLANAARLVGDRLANHPEVLVRKMAVADVYSAVARVASEVLAPDLVDDLLIALAEELFPIKRRK